jgi:hypothetical protein
VFDQSAGKAVLHPEQNADFFHGLPQGNARTSADESAIAAG